MKPTVSSWFWYGASTSIVYWGDALLPRTFWVCALDLATDPIAATDEGIRTGCLHGGSISQSSNQARDPRGRQHKPPADPFGANRGRVRSAGPVAGLLAWCTQASYRRCYRTLRKLSYCELEIIRPQSHTGSRHGYKLWKSRVHPAVPRSTTRPTSFPWPALDPGSPPMSPSHVRAQARVRLCGKRRGTALQLGAVTHESIPVCINGSSNTAFEL
jgi:hypothetical protein